VSASAAINETRGVRPGFFALRFTMRIAFFLIAFTLLLVPNALLISDIRHGLGIPPLVAVIVVTSFQTGVLGLLDRRNGIHD